jgi:hypothetical protein
MSCSAQNIGLFEIRRLRPLFLLIKVLLSGDEYGARLECYWQIGMLLTGWNVTDRFFRAFSSVVRQMPGYNSQRQGTARTIPN